MGESIASWKARASRVFLVESGGKKILVAKKVGIYLAGLFLLATAILAWLGPTEDITHYSQSHGTVEDSDSNREGSSATDDVANLFGQGEAKRKRDAENQRRANSKKKSSIKYFTSQLIGSDAEKAKTMLSGSKLLGVLLNPIDTRADSPVRAKVIRDAASGGLMIEKGSVLVGRFSYSGSGDRVRIDFDRVVSSSGKAKKISAQALDASSFTAGITGEAFSEEGIKIASQLGLSMFSGMADVLTEKESLGFAQGSIQAKPTMKNALLQGLSGAARDQSQRTARDIESLKEYVLVEKGKELIIELTEDYK